MRKIIFLIILLFPTLTFGQSFEGNYRAIFFNLFSEPKTIIAEFEVKSDSSITGKVKIGEEVKIFTGTVEKNGKFEAISQSEGNAVYKLKGKFDKNNKISFIRRIEERSPGNKSVSENGLEGTFAKVENVETKVEKTKTLPDTEFKVSDNGKSQLIVQHSNPLFGDQWNDFVGNVVFKGSETEKRMELTANVTIEQQMRSIRIFTKPMQPNQKFWKTTNIQTASYREEKPNTNEKNTFLAGSIAFQLTPALQNGTIEIVSESDTQLVFKFANFKIKRLEGEEFVEINGFIYANKVN